MRERISAPGGRAILVALCVLVWAVADAQPLASASRTSMTASAETLLKHSADSSKPESLSAQRREAGPPSAPALGSKALGERLTQIRRHILGVLAAIPALPREVRQAEAALWADMSDIGPLRFVSLIAIFVGLGLGAEALYRRLTRRFVAGVAALPVATARERVTAIVACLAQDLGRLAAFATGAVGVFLVLEWPILLRDMVLAFLLAIVGIRFAWVMLMATLSPPGRRQHPSPGTLRIAPLADDQAGFWTTRLTAAAAVFGIGLAALACLREVGFSPEARYLFAYAFGLGLLGLGIEAVWRNPAAPSLAAEQGIARATVVKWLLTLYFVGLWGLWAAHAMPLFWLAVVAALLPSAIRWVQPCIMRVARGPAEADVGATPPTIAAASLERGLRALLIVSAVLLLAWAWDIQLIAMAHSDTFVTRALRGLMSAVIIVLVADFVWRIAHAAIDLKIAEVSKLGERASDETQRRARLRTLLPILRIALTAAVVTIAALTALASLGIEIGPLVAGAGIIGVAVGFGSQTLVRDIVSGIFYLLDDAFRVGDYIVSGNYQGTVESFSLRSVRLRHHRGAIYTVPFGMLGAVQNLSRDWVIEKIMIGVTYDSDIEKARKVIKKIGLELAEDPEFKSSILEPLKMQGVENLAESAIQLRLKMMTKPQEQYAIKRRALARIKQEFEANGIKFAYPTVQIASAVRPDGDAAAFAAASAALQRPQAAE